MYACISPALGDSFARYESWWLRNWVAERSYPIGKFIWIWRFGFRDEVVSLFDERRDGITSG